MVRKNEGSGLAIRHPQQTPRPPATFPRTAVQRVPRTPTSPQWTNGTQERKMRYLFT